MRSNFRISEWLIEPDLNRVSRDGKAVQIEPKVMDVLVCLAEHPGRVLPRKEMTRAVWQDVHVSDEALTYAISELRRTLEDDARNPRIIQTIPRRGYRMIAHVSPAEPAPDGEAPQPAVSSAGRSWRRGLILAAAAAIIVAAAALWVFRPSKALKATDQVLLADFVNATGDPVFDNTLQIALSIHLGQSPFFNIVSAERVRETLRYMGRPPDARITRELGREICLRLGTIAMLAGSISSHGRNYVISLEAVNAGTGEVIGRQQAEAGAKEQVLKRWGKQRRDCVRDWVSRYPPFGRGTCRWNRRQLHHWKRSEHTAWAVRRPTWACWLKRSRSLNAPSNWIRDSPVLTRLLDRPMPLSVKQGRPS